MRAFLLATAFLLSSFHLSAQTSPNEVLDLSIPQEYRIGGITVMGAEYTDVQAIKLFSSLQVGASITIPG
ncbi:MAG TPA: hypothetical protein EYN19_03780, partial [Flavobacteriales bacterium]|nr:hypothetical protein [Flavobacteriales bacterium]